MISQQTIIVVAVFIILFLQICSFIMQICQCCDTTPMVVDLPDDLPVVDAEDKKHKFFMTTAPEFATVYIDWSYTNISILGEYIPFQIVQLTPTDDNTTASFIFKGISSDNKDVGGVGVYDCRLDQVLLTFGDKSLELHSSNPKNLIENVQDVYSKSRVFRRR